MVTSAPKNRQKEISQKEIDRISAMNVVAFKVIDRVRKYINNRLPYLNRIKDNAPLYTKELKKIEKYLIDNYGVMFKNFKSMIVDSLNASGLEQRYLAEMALGEEIRWNKAVLYSTLPKTPPFKITNRILSQKSVLRRNQILANRVTGIIKQSVEVGKSIPETQKLLDIEFGFRDKSGRTTRSALADLKKGKFAHSNGHFYQTYRIARTETLRMHSIQSNNTTEELQAKYEDVRLQMVAVIDSRTRNQSIQMDGQLSTEKLTFKYPNGVYYKHGQAPGKYSINDRETTITVFLDDDKEQVNLYESLEDFESQRKNAIYK